MKLHTTVWGMNGMETKQFLGSSTLTRATYDPSTRLLRLWFTSNPVNAYDYPGVPEHIWRGLVTALSPGTYYNDHIRDRYGYPR